MSWRRNFRSQPHMRPKRRWPTPLKALMFGMALCLAGVAIYPFIALSSGRLHAWGGPFALIDQTGRRVTDRDLRGKPTLITFGFTSCPDVCPTTLAHMTRWLQALGPAGDRLNMVYVTVDPERDTPQRLRAYLSAFDPRIRGLTGSAPAIARIAHEYRVYNQKVPLAGGGYTVDHSSTLYLVDAQGRLIRPIAFDDPDAAVLPLLRGLAAKTPPQGPRGSRE
jgi:protein SCO1/2